MVLHVQVELCTGNIFVSFENRMSCSRHFSISLSFGLVFETLKVKGVDMENKEQIL